MADPLDPLGPRLTALLDCVVASLDSYGTPVCRAFVHPGAVAPHDVCDTDGDRDGQAWVAAQGMFPTDEFPAEDLGVWRCAPVEFAAEVAVGVVRCTPTVDDAGRPPAAESVTASALRSVRDAAALREALLCCFAGDEPGVFRLGRWTPLGPGGGCAGGQWSATVLLPACPC